MTEQISKYNLQTISRFLQVVFFTVLILYFGKVLFLILYFGKVLLVPLSFGLLIAIISYPGCKWLEQKRWPRGLAVSTLMLFIIAIFGLLLTLLGYELNLFFKDIPQIKNRMSMFSIEISQWLQSLGVQSELQHSLISRIKTDFNQSINSYLGGAISATTSTLFSLIMIPIYGSLFLYHRKTFVRFLHAIAGNRYRDKLNSILQLSIHSYFSFIKGTFIVYCIVGVLNSIGLLMLGIEHAILFGVVTAFMTIVPYVGIIISAALPVAVALITKDSIWYAAGVIFVFTVVQYLEANIIFPHVVGQQINLSTWAVLVAIVIGTLLWGIAGMILFIPFMAILKIVSDHLEGWEPLNILLNRNE